MDLWPQNEWGAALKVFGEEKNYENVTVSQLGALSNPQLAEKLAS